MSDGQNQDCISALYDIHRSLMQQERNEIKEKLTDENHYYIGDGVYAYIDEHNRLLIFTYSLSGMEISDRIFLEENVLENLLRVYEKKCLKDVQEQKNE